MDMPTIAFVSPKGGAGKTTSALLLSTTLAKLYDVTVIDADPNHPIQTWAAGGKVPPRINPFANLTEPQPVFTTKPKREKPVEADVIARLAEDNNFPSRQATKTPKEPRRKRRVYTTGRNRQFNIKATSETVERFYKMADDRNVSLCKLLEHALDALEGQG
jgi:hypothetical protein